VYGKVLDTGMMLRDIPCRLRIMQKEYQRHPHQRRRAKAARAVKHLTRKPLIIYQMAKVGSSSVLKSLNVYDQRTIHHLHFLKPENVAMFTPRLRHAAQEPFLQNIQQMHLQRLADFHAYAGNCRGLKVITLVRDPIARNISLFFQHFAAYTGFRPADSHLSVRELTDIFLYRFQHAIPLVWFDIELRETLGIDVYQDAFPKDIGYIEIKRNDIHLLLIKSEISDTRKEVILTRFLGLDDFHLVTANVSQDKEYGQLYRTFLQEVRLPHSYVETMCHSKYLTHFYTPAEIDRIRKKWTN
jgi:hypothetical protein